MTDRPINSPRGRHGGHSWLTSLIVGLGAATLFSRGGAARPARPARKGRGDAHEARGEGDRGRSATTPAQIPAPGWKDILFRVWSEMQEDRLLSVAAGVTFYSLLALFPAIAAFVSIYGLVADASTIQQHLQSLSFLLPGGAIDVIGEQVKRIASQGNDKLSMALAFSVLLSLWSANAGMKALFDALNVVYEEEEKRSFIRLNATSLAFTVGAIVFMMLAIAGIVAVPIVLKFVGLGAMAEALIKLARWPVLLVVIALALSVIYRYGPSRERAQWRWVTWGSAFASVAWIVVSILFSWYAANFGSYNETYGSLGAVIGFMTWIWLSTTVILLGAELNAEIEHQTAADTTTDAPRPLGARGARMADTVGAPKAS
ncbi:YihY/virulence factor BrkB family protein [Alsobacter sp. SYSU M60028]|uniref:YihY/virulence factor BrkB family protein n=1 Tax=Alsobacter ponti TaxID=2962936 RepID=A0ABT1LDU0_9HYPH|nr:YihY/virulence factor BrkB family protein [Alsobacter ponti]MCP8939594.1 YihY/virulence factor BrkB family protein [Alsobacter ponti]